jgi:hypothetical protein
MPMPEQSCPCVKTHSPKPLAFQVHHVTPKSWGGKDVADNKVTICGTCHDNTHTLLNEYVRAQRAGTPLGKDVIGKYPKFTQELAERAIAGVGGNIPNIFTMPGLPEHANDLWHWLNVE